MAEAPRRILVVGAGLIGTSIGLALRDVADVLLDDTDPAHVDVAAARGAGRRWDRKAVDHAVVCAPPAVTASVIGEVVGRNIASTISHVASAQSRVEAEVETAGRGRDVCGGHPLAGRETRGPAAASGRLFVDRTWVVCPGPSTSAPARAAVEWLAAACGAVPVVMSAEAHDRAVALTSHLPQVVASALAAALARAAGTSAVALAGQGLQDTTRIAASDPALWTDILTSNAEHVAPLVASVADDLRDAAAALQALAAAPTDARALATLVDLLQRGGAGRALLPLKERTADADYATVAVGVPDEPGQLAGVLAAAARAGVNVEDVRVEHLPGRPRGVVELVVARDSVPAARSALAADGWDVLGRSVG